jgi:menaquinone-dependent protoporphyrinogen oxidase
MNLAIVYSSAYGSTLEIANRLATRLRGAGHTVDLYEASHPFPNDLLKTLDGVIVGSWVRAGRHMPAVQRFVEDHRELLGRVPSAFYSVSLLQISTRPESRAHAREVLPRFLAETRWRPDLSAVFAGALRFTRFGWLSKRIMRLIWRREGVDVDLTKDAVYTDWADVDRFADDFAARLLPAGRRIPVMGPSAAASGSPESRPHAMGR